MVIILDSRRSKFSSGLSKTWTHLLCDLLPSFNSSGAQNDSWVTHGSQTVLLPSTSAGTPGSTSGKRQGWCQSRVRLYELGFQGKCETSVLWELRSAHNAWRSKYQAIFQPRARAGHVIRTASEFPACLGPQYCHLHGNLGEEKENRSHSAWGPQGGEEDPKDSSWTRDTETTFPGVIRASLREWGVFTCWCVNGVTWRASGVHSSLPE